MVRYLNESDDQKLIFEFGQELKQDLDSILPYLVNKYEHHLGISQSTLKNMFNDIMKIEERKYFSK